MNAKSSVLLRATLTMLGTIIGAGVFAVPMGMAQAGIFAGSLLFWGMALVILTTHLLYIDVIFSSPAMRRGRLPSQARRLLGKAAGWAAVVTHPCQIIGSCLAYIILGGEFLSVIAGAVGLPAKEFGWQILFWFGGAVTVFIGLKFIVKLESFLTWALIGFMSLAVLLFGWQASPGSFFEANWASFMMPIGVFTFAAFGMSVIPEIAQICQNDLNKTRLSVAGGTLGAALLTWLFGVMVAAAVGKAAVTPMAMASALPSWASLLIPCVGFLAVATSFITLMQDLKTMLHTDLHLPQRVSWALALLAPLSMLLFVTRNFFSTVNLVGSVFTAFNGLIASLMAYRVYRARKQAAAWQMVIPFVPASVFVFMIIWRIMHLV